MNACSANGFISKMRSTFVKRLEEDQMPKIIRTTDFVAEVKDLARRGYTKADI
ncbi:hypothetical protein LEP1GSC130_0135 [Leptospira santarosai str. 200403458]|nr:hypothetical protein LEP1GSC130_0135 [Leptospira santarosai str. 200403458]